MIGLYRIYGFWKLSLRKSVSVSPGMYVRKCVDRESERLGKINLDCGIFVCKTILESNNELDFRQFGILRSIDFRIRRFQESHLVRFFSGFLPFYRDVDGLAVDIKYSGA